jgi:long-chain fatty acid transport protein
MKFGRWRETALGLLAAFCFTSTTAEGILASVKSLGMGGAATAYPLDTLSAAFNPAGIVEIGDRFDIEGDVGRFRGKSTITGSPLPGINGNYSAFRTRDIYAGALGISKQFCVNCYPFTLGLIGYNRTISKTTYKTNFPIFGTSHLGVEYMLNTISPVLGIQIHPCHTIAISANYYIQRLKLNGLQNIDNPLLSSNPGHVTNRGYNYSQGWGYTVGWKTQLMDCLAFGAAFTPKSKMRRFHHYSGFVPERGRIDVPQRIIIGTAWTPISCFTAAFDVEWEQLARVRAFHNPLLNSAGGSNLAGTNHGPGYGLRNRTYYRVGIDWQVNCCLSVRAGYRHSPTPLRRSQTLLNAQNVETQEDYFTAGATYALNFCNEISVFVAYSPNNKVRGKNSIPLAFGGGEVNLQQNIQVLGVSWGWMF